MSKGLSIITPHKNDVKGLQRIYELLSKQTSDLWQWVIVDDCSDSSIQDAVKLFFDEVANSKITVVYNTSSTNASVCRNKGADFATFQNLVFLDADDVITETFVKNRLIDIIDFTVLLNFNIINEKVNKPFSNIKSDFLTHFLKAQFPWQTTAIVWNKTFFIAIGKFDKNLRLLQDVEMAIRALLLSKNYNIVLDNEVDFYYYVKPIDITKRNVEKVSVSVDYLINKLYKEFSLNNEQLSFLSSYYYLSVRYLCKSNKKEDFNYLQTNLKNLYTKKCYSFLEYIFGGILLKMFKNGLLTKKFFLRVNRYIFK